MPSIFARSRFSYWEHNVLSDRDKHCLLIADVRLRHIYGPCKSSIALSEPSNLYVSTMDQILTFSAILFPSDGRHPHLVQLMASPANPPTYHDGQLVRIPHPEVHMDYIADGLGHGAWGYHLVEALDGMNRKFASPYVIFYPRVSRDGMAFPINKCIREIQTLGAAFVEDVAWRGNIVIGKYRQSPWTSMTDASMADFPILKNYLLTHGSPPFERLIILITEQQVWSLFADSMALSRDHHVLMIQELRASSINEDLINI